MMIDPINKKNKTLPESWHWRIPKNWEAKQNNNSGLDSQWSNFWKKKNISREMDSDGIGDGDTLK